jgi:hypothetical protein
MQPMQHLALLLYAILDLMDIHRHERLLKTVIETNCFPIDFPPTLLGDRCLAGSYLLEE